MSRSQLLSVKVKPDVKEDLQKIKDAFDKLFGKKMSYSDVVEFLISVFMDCKNCFEEEDKRRDEECEKLKKQLDGLKYKAELIGGSISDAVVLRADLASTLKELYGTKNVDAIVNELVLTHLNFPKVIKSIKRKLSNRSPEKSTVF